MGLDMYLNASRYISGTLEEMEYDRVFKAISDSHQIPTFWEEPSITVEVCLMYWRKANAIHNWFVQNCAGGVDECQRIYVKKDHLQELYDICKEIMALSDYQLGDDEPVSKEVEEKCIELLPPISGFFFGSTEIDSWYFKDIYLTQQKLKDIIKWIEEEQNNGRYWSIIYQASW